MASNKKYSSKPPRRKWHHPVEFSYAVAGIRYALTTQPNFMLHVITGMVVLALGIMLDMSRGELTFIVTMIALVMTLELVNTALETVVDLVSPNYHPLAKIAKDVAAGAVLMMSLGAAGVGLLLFLPKILDILS